MTIAEMHDQFRIEYDNIDSFSNPGYLPGEIDYFLNSAQDQLLTLAKAGGVESTQTLRDMLANITLNYTTSTFIANSENEDNGIFVQLPAGYRTALKESVTITMTDCNNSELTKKVPVVPTTHDRLNYDVRNPFKRPNQNERVLGLPYRYLTNDPTIQTIELITDGNFTIDSYHLRYLKNPIQMDSSGVTPVDCELNEEAQNWIIKQAVLEAVKATSQAQKYQLLKQ